MAQRPGLGPFRAGAVLIAVSMACAAAQAGPLWVCAEGGVERLVENADDGPPSPRCERRIESRLIDMASGQPRGKALASDRAFAIGISNPSRQQVTSAEQLVRDEERRAILNAELERESVVLGQLVGANTGGDEMAVRRAVQNIASLKREIARLATPPSGKLR